MLNFTVALRIFGEGVDPKHITQALGLTPSFTRNTGDVIGNHVSKEAIWEYDGHPPEHYWASIEDGLLFLINGLTPHQKKIAEYQSKYYVLFWIGQFQSGFSGGPIFSPRLLKILADFGVELAIDCYFYEETSTQ